MKAIQDLSQEHQSIFEKMYELNMNYWQNFSECEKRMYAIIVAAEKEITFDVLFKIIAVNFDLGFKPHNEPHAESYFF